MLKQAPFLKKNDTVAIVAIARNIDEASIRFAINVLNDWGLKVKLGKHIFKKHYNFAGTDEERVSDLQNALDDSNIKAIICARGGYGAIRILDKLNFSKFNKNPKWLVGYSDVTVLHSFINNILGIQTIHATMPLNFKTNTPESLTSLKNALFGTLTNTIFGNDSLNKEGECEGEIIGGNLSILYSLLGTKYGFNTNNRILFIEEVDEYLYHIDRMMISFKLSGKLTHLQALLVGQFTNLKDNESPFGKTFKEIILNHCKDYSYPIFFNAPFGHACQNKSIYFGKNATLKKKLNNVVIDYSLHA